MSKTRKNVVSENGKYAKLFNEHNKAKENIAKATANPMSEGLKAIVRGRSYNQKNYIKTIRDNDITFSTGIAGTGKTHIAVGLASYYLYKGVVDRIIVTRPVVPCDEEIGFLPGDINDKVSPYLRPIFDEFSYFFTPDQMKFLRNGEMPIIEIVPLAFIKGRTFKKSFIILDEAQDATYLQLKRFISRLGDNSKMVITGDVTQTDRIDQRSGEPPLNDIIHKLKDIEGVGLVRLDPSDIQRHPRLAQILEVI